VYDAQYGFEEQIAGENERARQTRDSTAGETRKALDRASKIEHVEPEVVGREHQPALMAFADDLARLAVAAYMRGDLPRGFAKGGARFKQGCSESANVPTCEVGNPGDVVELEAVEAPEAAATGSVPAPAEAARPRKSVVINEQHK